MRRAHSALPRWAAPVLIAAIPLACAPAAVSPPRATASAVASAAPTTPAAPAYQRPPTEDAPFRANAPPLAAPAPFAFPAVHSFRLSNGLRVWLAEDHTVGFVQAEVMLHARPAPLGANALAAVGVRYGTATLPLPKLQAADDADAAQMAAWYSWGWIRVAMRAPSDRAAPVVARLAETALVAALQPNDVVTNARDAADKASTIEASPFFIASHVLPAVLYRPDPRSDPRPGSSLGIGDDDPDAVGSKEYGALTRDQVMKAYQAALDPSSAVLVVSGDVTEKTVRPLIEKAFASWHKAPGSPPAAWPVRTVSTGTGAPRVFVVHRSGPESLIVFGGEGPRYTSADAPATLLLKQLLAGPKGTVVAALHDLHGRGTAFSLDFDPRSPRVSISATVETGHTAEALKAVDRLLRGAKTMKMAPEDLEEGRRMERARVFQWMGSVQGVAGMLEGLVLQGGDGGGAAKMEARLANASADDVRHVAEKYLDVDRMKVVVVGDFAKLKPVLDGLGWGAVDLRTNTGAEAGGQDPATP